MFHQIPYPQNKEEAYQLLFQQANALFLDVNDAIANYANASALLAGFLQDINWVGFYLYKESELLLGPFQGKPACVRIAIGKGVCGTAAAAKTTLRIANVHEFPGHIACDEASKSEIVIPLIKNGAILGVLDIDAPIYDRFDEIDQRYLEEFVSILLSFL